MKSTDQGFVKSCESKVAEIPRENWDMVGATVIRAMSARLTEVNASIKNAERELYDVCFQVVVEGESLRQTELEGLKGAYENLTETIERLKSENDRLEERKGNYSKFSSGLNPARYAPTIKFR